MRANLCNGTLFCDKSTKPYACVDDPKTIVTCDTSKDPQCKQNTCDKASGKCGLVTVNEGKGCDADGSVCTVDDLCKAGACAKGVAKKCDDGNVCTDDSCDATTGCKTVDNVAKCPDEDVCTESEACKSGSCSKAAVKCDDGNACTDDSCDKTKGCVKANNTATCADSDACTVSEVCKAGACTTQEKGCDDKNPCTVDSCEATAGCKVANDKDGAKCGADKVCDVGKCVDAGLGYDFDHDGVCTGACTPSQKDTCPTVWNPDNDPAACKAWDGAGWKQSRKIVLGQAGKASTWRRTNEPVEVPLVNGILDASVVGYWKLDGNFTGAVGQPKQTVLGNPKPVEGAFGAGSTALAFDGKQDAADLWTGRTHRFGAGFTVMAWLRGPAAGKAPLGIVASTLHGDKDKDRGWLLVLNPGGQIYFHLAKAGSQHHLYVAGPTDGAWHHVAAVSTGHEFLVFVDGALVGRKPGTPAAGFDSGNRVGVGAHQEVVHGYPHGGWFAGAIDELVVLDRAVSAPEVAEYVNSKAPYGSNHVAGAQADFDDVRVTETAAWQKEHGTHVEVIGARPHSDSDLKDVVAYWKLDGNTLDAAGAHDGKIGSGGFTVGRFGDDGGAFKGDGSTSYVTTGWIPSFPAGASFTLEAWVRFMAAKTTSEHSAFLSVKPETGSDGEFTFTYGPNSLYMQTGSAGSAYGGVTFEDLKGKKWRDGRWHHVAAVRDGAAKESRLYVDGLLQKADADQCLAVNIAGASKRPALIGAVTFAGNAGVAQHLRGDIDEVIVHKVAKSANYIANRARGLPRVRFLAHTVATKTGGTYPFLDYRLHWGNPAAKALPAKLVGLDKKTPCDTLLSPCLGYLAWWRLDDSGPGVGGAVTLDASSHSRQLRLHDKAHIGSGHHGAGYAAAADGHGAHTATGTPFDLANYTIEASVRHTGKSGGIVALGSISGAGWMSTRAGGAATCGLAGNAVADTAAVGKDQWSHLACTYDGKTLRTFLAGAAATQGAVAKPAWGKGELVVGARVNGTDVIDKLSGGVDEVRVMNRVLTADELLHFPAVSWALPCGADADCDDGDGGTHEFCEVASGQCRYHGAASMVQVPAGPFWMGCNEKLDTACKSNEKPQHQVTLSAYSIDRYEVSIARYKVCVAAGKCPALPVFNYVTAGRDAHPVNGVTMAEAEAFCAFEGKTLPTIAQWEKAARGGCEIHPGKDCKTAMRVYPWGNEAPDCTRAWFAPAGGKCASDTTTEVGALPAGASPYGALNMAGNVDELTRDDSLVAYKAAARTDPYDPPSGLQVRVGGGDYRLVASQMRSSARLGHGKLDRRPYIGFRCVVAGGK